MGAEGVVGGSIKRGFSHHGPDTRTPPIESGPGWRQESPRRTKTIPEAPPRPAEDISSAQIQEEPAVYRGSLEAIPCF